MPRPAKKVYLLHGWAANRHVFNDLIPRLPANWQIEALNLPGHGDAPHHDAFDVAAVADDYANIIEDNAYILGWSLGGMLASELAALRGECCRGLLTLASNLLTDILYGVVDPRVRIS